MSPSGLIENAQLCENSRVIVHGTIGMWHDRCSIYDPDLPMAGLENQKRAFRGGIVIALPGLSQSLRSCGRMTYGGLGQVRQAVVIAHLRRCEVDHFLWKLDDLESVSLMEDLNAVGLPSPMVITPEYVQERAKWNLANLEADLREYSSPGYDVDKVLAEKRKSLSSW